MKANIKSKKVKVFLEKIESILMDVPITDFGGNPLDESELSAYATKLKSLRFTCPDTEREYTNIFNTDLAMSFVKSEHAAKLGEDE